MLAAGFILGIAGCSKEAEAAPAQETNELSTTAGTATTAAGGDGTGSLLLKQDNKLAMFAGVTLSGEAYGPELLKQQNLTMMNIWTTTCPYCIEEMPMLENLSGRLEAAGIHLIGVIGDGRTSGTAAQRIIDSTGVTYLNIVPDKKVEKTIFEIAYAVPTTIFVDGNGKVIGEPILGMRAEEEYYSLAMEALGSL